MKASALRDQGMNAKTHATQEVPMLKKLTVAGSLAVLIGLGSLTPLSAAQNPPAQGAGEPQSQSDMQDTKKMHGGKMDGGKMDGGKMHGGKMHGGKMHGGKNGAKMAQMKAGKMNEHKGPKPEQKMGGREMKK
jgi:hypothetical protein